MHKLTCKLFLSTTFLLLILLIGCDKKDAIDPCIGINYNTTFTKSEAIGAANNGTIQITFPVGDTISYSLNNNTFQTAPNFTNLAAGNYVKFGAV